MLVNDANGKHLVAPGVLYVIQKYVYKKNKKNKKNHHFIEKILKQNKVINALPFVNR